MLFALICSFTLQAQGSLVKAGIVVSGHYVEGKGIEVYATPVPEGEFIRKFIKGGYVLERSADGKNFQPIGTSKHISVDELENIIQKEQDKSVIDKLNSVLNFLEHIDEEAIPEFDEEKGLRGVKAEKSRQDLVYFTVMLSIIQNPIVAEYLGIKYMDSDVERGKTYYYRVKPLAKFEFYDVSNKTLELVAEPRTDYTKEIKVVSGESSLGFSWERDDLIGYYVERKAYNETEFKSLTDNIQFTLKPRGYKGGTRGAFRDTSLVNYKPYTYRFYANTFWGEKVLFGEVTAHSVDKTPPPPPYVPQPKQIKPDEVLISWEIPDDVPDLWGFIVSRGVKVDGDFKILHNKIIPKNYRKFVDKTFRTDTLNYYMVQAIDTAKNVSSSEPNLVVIIDSMPPAKPVFINSSIDDKGVVTLEVKKNTERDLMGYRLFKANSPDHEFSVIYEGFKRKGALDTIPTVFHDTTTLKTLTPNVYYRIKALDYHYNQSEFSDIVKVKRPDTIPPAKPLIRNVEVYEDRVVIFFALSPSKDVVSQMIYRREDMKAPWKLLDTLQKGQHSYVDTAVTKNVTYYYSLRAKDDSDLYSPYSNSVFARPYDTGVRPPVTNFRGNKKEDRVLLSWEYANMNKDTFFVIYRTNKKGNLVQYKRTDTLTNNLNYEGAADYAVKVFTKDGGTSKLSNKVNIK